MVIHPDGVIDFLDKLPVKALWGVGPATVKRLAQLGITCRFRITNISARCPEGCIRKGAGAHLTDHFGIDERSVEPTHEAKSISNEETFASDLFDLPRVHSEIFTF